jgi:hypothetical protein
MMVTVVMEEAMEAIEVMVIDSGAPAVVLAVTKEVGHSSTRASHAIVNTNNWVGAATSSRVVVAPVAVVEAHISMPVTT